jgi:hypothetical protein
MKLNKIHMIGIVIACVLFAQLFKFQRYEGFDEKSPDYGQIMIVYKQIELLQNAITKLDAIPVSKIDYVEKATIKQRIELVEKQLQGWITDRSAYLNKNNVIETKPNTNETLNGLKNIWLGKEKEGGSNVLIKSSTDKLDPSDEKQGEIIKILKTIKDNIDSELL